MADMIQKIGFDAGGAMNSLTKFSNGLLLVAASMTKFKRSADQVGKVRLGDGLKKFVPVATQARMSLAGIGKAALTASSKIVKFSKDGTKGADALTLSWQTFSRIIQTQVLLRGFTALKRIMGEATDSAKQFGLAVAEIQTIAGNALGTSNTLAASIHNVANAMGVTSQQVAEGVYQTISNQVGNAAEAMGVLVDAQKLATITGSSTAASVNAISSVLNSYGMAASEAGNVSDILFKTVELGRLRLEDIANVLGRVTPLTAELGISFKETASAIATMTRQGVKADTSITQLRAVTQKLIKPTEKMVALFRRWGVADGKQAIKTFGGLTGVLKKLAQETDNNSTEMASYFNRVRAIVGQMGIMSERGQRMADTMKAMDEATGAATTAWERFTQSDAFELEKAQAEFNNELTRTGSATLKVATFWNQWKTVMLQNASVMIDALQDVSKETKDLEQSILNIAKSTPAAIAEAAAEIKVVTQVELDEMLQYERLHIAEMNKLWNEGTDNIGDNMSRMVQGVRGSLEDMFKGVKSKLKPITDLAKVQETGKTGLEGKLQEARDLQATTRQGVADKNLTKFQQIDKRIAKAMSKSRQASRAYSKGVTDDQLKIAESMNKAAMAAANEALALAKVSGSAYKIQEAEKALQKVQDRNVRGLEKADKLRRDYAPQAAKVKTAIASESKKWKALTTQVSKYVKALSEAKTPAEEAGIRKKLDGLFEELSTFKMPELTPKLLEAFGAENLPQEIQKQLLDQALKVHAEVELDLSNAQKQMDVLNAEAEAKLDPTGKKAISAFGVLGREMNKGEGFANYLSKANEEAAVGLKRQTQIQSDLNGAVMDEKKARQAVNEVQEAFNEAANTRLKHERAVAPTAPISASPQYMQAREERISQAAKDGSAAVQQLGEMYGRYNDQLARGEPLVKGQLDAWNMRLQKVNEANRSTEYEIKLADVANTSIKNLNRAVAGVEEKKAIFDPQELSSSQAHIDEISSDITRTKDAMQLLQNQTRAVATNTATFATKANEALGGTSGLVTGWNSITSAVERAADAAVKAYEKVLAAKRAAASAPAAEFHGGIQHLAAGGSAQGQDSINAMLSPGEFVSSAATTRKFYSELNAMNNGSRPVFREQGGSVTTVGDVNVTVNGGDSSQQTVREIGHGLRREMRRGTLTLN